jgi:hypothetical protein
MDQAKKLPDGIKPRTRPIIRLIAIFEIDFPSNAESA